MPAATSARAGRSRVSAAVVPTCSALSPADLDQPMPPPDRPSRPDRRPASSSCCKLRRANAHGVLGRALHELVDAHVGDQPTSADHDQVLGGERHLAHQMRGDEYRAALARRAAAAGCGSTGCPRGRARSPARRASPCAGRRAARTRSRAAGPSRARSSPARLRATSSSPTRSISSSTRRPADAVRLGQHQQVVIGRAARMNRARLEQRADLVQRRGMVAIPLSVDRTSAPSGASRPRISRIVVDLPEPFGPRKPVTTPAPP